MLQVYIRKLTQCLLEVTDTPDSPTWAELQKWSAELISLFVCLCIANPKLLDTVRMSRMDDGSVNQEPPPDKVYDNLLVSHEA